MAEKGKTVELRADPVGRSAHGRAAAEPAEGGIVEDGDRGRTSGRRIRHRCCD